MRNVLWSRASVCLSAAACPHYCTDPDVIWGSGRGCPLVVHYWVDLQSVHGLHCYGNIMRNVSEYMLVLVLCPVNLLLIIIRPHRSTTYVDAAYSYRPSSVVCRSVTLVSPAKTAAPIELPFGLRTWVARGTMY